MTDLSRFMESVAVAFVAAIPGVLLFINARRKQLSDDTVAAVGIYREMIDPLRQRLAELEHEQDIQEAEIKALREQSDRDRERISAQAREIAWLVDGVHRLIAQLRRGGEEPDWSPIDWGSMQD